MSLLFLSLLLLLLLFLSPLSSSSTTSRRLLQSTNTTTTASCPLNFTALQQLVGVSNTRNTNLDTPTRCQYIKQGLRLVESLYLQTSNNFLPPLTSASSCWADYQSLVDSSKPSSRHPPERRRLRLQPVLVQRRAVRVVHHQPLQPPGVVPDRSIDREPQRLHAYPSIYAAAFANRFGPTDQGTAQCLFGFNFDNSSGSNNNNQRNIVIWVVVILFVVFLFLGFGGFCFIWRRSGKKKRKIISGREMSLAVEMESINQSTTLVTYTFDDIRQATKNFNRDNIIGRGGYGNVYKGVLEDGSEVAMKRFKNCSESGDATFAHEVEVIASVRHVNLVALRGYCTATTPLEGHQRIIVCDLMRNGSLHDHLFGMSEEKLSWPLLSGKKALMAVNDGQPSLVTEWAWDLVRKGRALDVIEDGMPDLGPPEVLEKTTDPSYCNIDDIEKSMSSSGSGNLSTAAGYQPYTSENGHPMRHSKEERETSDCPLRHNKEEGENSAAH
ncbi:hypothetical protein C3L33_04075, partial [Rhododendron williamsianum]